MKRKGGQPIHEGVVRLPGEKGLKPWLGRKESFKTMEHVTDSTVVGVNRTCVCGGKKARGKQTRCARSSHANMMKKMKVGS